MTSTAAALAAVRPDGEVVASTLGQRAVDKVTGWLSGRTSRRGFLLRAGLLGTALAVDPKGYVLRPGTAYAAVCGPGSGATSGWTVFCATINDGVNACPPGSRAGICASSCWSCSCESGLPGTCDQRKVCCNAFRYGQCNQDVRQVGGVHCRVVSCTPPWKFERCSTAPATDNRTVDHNSDRLPQAYTPITSQYIFLGENGSVLGASVYGELVTAGGRAQRYQRGRISYKSSTGARETVGPVADRYVAIGAEAGPLGFPVTSPLPVTGGSGQRFENGRISSSDLTGAWETQGAIAVAYTSSGAEGGHLGFPTGGDTLVGDGLGRYTLFQRGRISFSAGTGAHAVDGAIHERYVQLGAEGGSLGYPTADVVIESNSPFKRLGLPPDRRQEFERGTLMADGRTGLVVVIPRF